MLFTYISNRRCCTVQKWEKKTQKNSSLIGLCVVNYEFQLTGCAFLSNEFNHHHSALSV